MADLTEQMVTVRAADLYACLKDAQAHLGYWGASEEYEDRLDAALGHFEGDGSTTDSISATGSEPIPNAHSRDRKMSVDPAGTRQPGVAPSGPANRGTQATTARPSGTVRSRPRP